MGHVSSLKPNQQELSTHSLKHCAANHYKCIYPYLIKVQESFDVTEELFHGGLLDVQAEILNQFFVHGCHVFMHLHQNIDLVFGATVKTVSAVKEISYVPSLKYKKFIDFSTPRLYSSCKQPTLFAAQFIPRSRGLIRTNFPGRTTEVSFLNGHANAPLVRSVA